jgi:hypothetical protein
MSRDNTFVIATIKILAAWVGDAGHPPLAWFPTFAAPHARIVNLTNGYLAKKSALSKQAQSKLDVSTMSLADCWLLSSLLQLKS